MGRLRTKCDYEILRNARISENKARLESLGLHLCASELRTIISSGKCNRRYSTPRKRREKPNASTPLRRSERLKGVSGTDRASSSPQVLLSTPAVEEAVHSAQIRKRLFTDRCRRKSRGSIYDSVVGICCHFCRQKKLCGEEDCKRCEYGDVDQTCIGKTECSICHSSNGILCRACLKVRYGEEMEEVKMKNDWMCPHCIEQKGINPYWICNSSFCLKKRKMVPTGIAIYHARASGFKSVAHLLMEKLKEKAVQ